MTPEENAAKLTDGQRAWMLDRTRYLDPTSIRSLRKNGLVESRSIMLTVPGLEVRKILEQSHDQ